MVLGRTQESGLRQVRSTVRLLSKELLVTDPRKELLVQDPATELLFKDSLRELLLQHSLIEDAASLQC